MADHILRLGTYDFPDSLSVREIPQAVEVPTEAIPRRHGLARGTMRLREKQVTIEGMLSHVSQVRDVRDAVMSACANGRQKLYVEDADRYLWVQLADFNEENPYNQADKLRPVTIEFLSDTPFWESDTLSSNTWNTPLDGGDVTLTNAGNAETYPVFAITVAGTGTLNIAITVGASRTFTMNGAVTAADVYVVDCLEQTVVKQSDSSDKMSYFDGLFPWFSAGDNVVSLTNGGAIALTSIVTTWRNRWY